MSAYVSHFFSSDTATTSNPVLSSLLNDTNQSCSTLLSLALVYRLKDIPGLRYFGSLHASLSLSVSSFLWMSLLNGNLMKEESYENILHIGLHILNSSFAHVSCSLPDTVALKHTCVCVIGAGAQEGSWHAHKDVGGLWRWESTADPDAYRPPHQVPAGLPPLLRWRLERWSGTVPPVVCAAVRAEISTGITLAKLYLHRWAITGEILWDTGEEHVWLVLIVLFVSFGEKR